MWFVVEGCQQHLGQEVLVLIMFKRWTTFLFFCCLEQYKLVSVQTTYERVEISACRKACADHGMVLMSLDSDNDRKAIVSLSDYKHARSSLVVTDAIEILDKSRSSKFFSRPGGKQVNFIHLASIIGAGRGWRLHGTYSIVIYYDLYYAREYRDGVGKNDKCACKLGEWCLYNRHVDFDANKKCRRETRPAQYPATSA